MNNFLYQLLFVRLTPGLFRLFLAFLVVVYHTVGFITFGTLAVYLFFILSGYWIFKMYREKYSLYQNPYSVYLQSRIYRLIPVYFLVLFLSLLLYQLIPELKQELITGFQGNPLFYLNFLWIGLNFAPFKILVPAWSLDIELQFYILAPVLMMILSSKNKYQIPAFFIATGIALASVYSPHFLTDTLLSYLPYFLIGGLIYKTHYHPRPAISIMLVLIAVFIIFMHFLIPGLRNNYLLNPNALLMGFKYQEALNVILTCFSIPYIASNVHQKNSKYMQHDQIYTSMSYVIYLLHWPLLQVYGYALKNVSTMVEKSVYLLLYYFTCLLLSLLISLYFEPYLGQLRSSWLKKQMQH